MEEQLIEFVRKHNCLYDKSNPNYKVIPIRDKKFEELARKLNIPAKKLKARWRTLRDTFHKEVKAENFECVSSTKKQWKWMEHLMFLKNVNNSNSSTPIPARFSCRRTRTRFVHIGEDTSTDDLTLMGDATDTRDMPHANKFDFADERTSIFPTLERDIKPKFDEVTDESRNEIFVTPPKDILGQRAVKANNTSAVQLFFAGLAKQTEDANITPKEFAKLQLKLLQVFNKEVYDV